MSYLCAGFLEAADLFDRGLGVRGRRVGHRLDGDGGVAADEDVADARALIARCRRCAALVDAIRAQGGEAHSVPGDVTDLAHRARLLIAAQEHLGGLDFLVNNAGGPPPGDFRDWDRDAWLRAIDANMLTPIELIRATVDGMIERRVIRVLTVNSKTFYFVDKGVHRGIVVDAFRLFEDELNKKLAAEAKLKN